MSNVSHYVVDDHCSICSLLLCPCPPFPVMLYMHSWFGLSYAVRDVKGPVAAFVNFVFHKYCTDPSVYLIFLEVLINILVFFSSLFKCLFPKFLLRFNF